MNITSEQTPSTIGNVDTSNITGGYEPTTNSSFEGTTENPGAGGGATDVLTYGQHVFIKYFTGYFYQIFIAVIGCLGNGLVIAVLMRKKNRQSSTAIFLTALAASDTLILICYPLNRWLRDIWQISVRDSGNFGCKVHVFLCYVCPGVSSWVLVMVTFERVISVTFPHKIKSICTFNTAWITVTVVVAAVCSLNVHFLWGAVIKANEFSAYSCGAINEAYINFSHFYLPWIDFLAHFAVPCALIIVGNTIIIKQLSQNRLARKGMTSSKQSADNSVTFTLVIVNVAFILTQAPLFIVNIGFIYWYRTMENPQFMIAFWSPVINALAATNSAINFALYFLSGSRFRAEVKELLGCSTAASKGWFNDNKPA